MTMFLFSPELSAICRRRKQNELIVLQKNNTVTFREMDPEEEAELIKTMDEDKANRK